MQIVFLDRATFAESVTFDPALIGRCDWREFPVTAPEDVIARSRDAEVLIVNKVRLTAELLMALPRLKLISISATGVDNVDLESARRHGIAVCNVSGYAVKSVPEHVFAVLLALRRNLLPYSRAMGEGAWADSPVYCLHTFPIRDLAGSTLGIIGGGTLGQAVARLARAFGMKTLVAERRGVATPRTGRTHFEEVLASSDAITLHVPLTTETRGLIGKDEIAQMKRDAVLINAARGSVVDEDALLGALRTGKLAGAAIDVLATEPPPAEHPLITARLPNLMITPHVAWASLQAQQRLADEVIANIAAFRRGERRNRIV
jgi:glycerate dehydrogenase